MRTIVIIMCFVSLGFAIYMAVIQVDPDSVSLDEKESSEGVRFPNVVQMSDLPGVFEQRLNGDERQLIQREFGRLNSIFNQLEEQVAPFTLNARSGELKQGVKINSLGDGGASKEYRSRKILSAINASGTERFEFQSGILDMASGPVAAPALVLIRAEQVEFMLIAPGVETSRWRTKNDSCAVPCTGKGTRKALDSALGQCAQLQSKTCKAVPKDGDFTLCSQGLLVCLSNYWLELEKHRSAVCSCAKTNCTSEPKQVSYFCGSAN